MLRNKKSKATIFQMKGHCIKSVSKLLMIFFRILTESPYSKHDVSQLVSMLAEAPSIEEQADILHYLVLCYGPRHKFHVSQVNISI